MSSLGKVVYLSQAQFATLVSSGSVTVGGVTVTYSANDLYITPTPEIPMPSASDNGRVLGVTDSIGSLGWVSLQYDLVTAELGEWHVAFDDSSDSIEVTIVHPEGAPETAYWTPYSGGMPIGDPKGTADSVSLSWDSGLGEATVSFTATRALELLDRAGNRVVVTGDTTLTLPAAVPGHIRDFLVRLEISGSTVPTITFAAPTGETITYETDGDEFPVPDEAGTWLYSFTETAAHKFAVSLKKVNEVAAPQAQGGS